MIRPATAFLCLLSFAVSAGPALAKTVFDPHGGPGDIRNAYVCPPGKYLVGFEGRVGAWIDRIAPVCASLLHSGEMGKRKAVGAFGGGGGAPASTYCNQGLISRITSALTNDDRMVLWITFSCYNPVTGQKNPYIFHFGDTGGVPHERFQNPCPGGEAANGLGAYWGQHVNAVGLICDTLTIPP